MQRTTAFGFNARGQTTRTLPIGTETADDAASGGFTETMRYHSDASDGVLFGLLDPATDFERNTVSYGYDALGRETGRTYRDADGVIQRIVNTDYDGFGRVIEIRDSEGNAASGGGSGVTTHVYDAEGRLRTRTTPVGTLTYTYDPATGRQLTVTSSGGTSQRYAYDVLGRLTSVEQTAVASGTDAAASAVRLRTENGYRDDGSLDWELDGSASGGGLTTDHVYDDLGRVTLGSIPLLHTSGCTTMQRKRKRL